MAKLDVSISSSLDKWLLEYLERREIFFVDIFQFFEEVITLSRKSRVFSEDFGFNFREINRIYSEPGRVAIV